MGHCAMSIFGSLFEQSSLESAEMEMVWLDIFFTAKKSVLRKMRMLFT
jgi:hypothetical protein